MQKALQLFHTLPVRLLVQWLFEVSALIHGLLLPGPLESISRRSSRNTSHTLITRLTSRSKGTSGCPGTGLCFVGNPCIALWMLFLCRSNRHCRPHGLVWQNGAQFTVYPERFDAMMMCYGGEMMLFIGHWICCFQCWSSINTKPACLGRLSFG